DSGPPALSARTRTGLGGNASGLCTLPLQISDIENSSSRDSPRRFAAHRCRVIGLLCRRHDAGWLRERLRANDMEAVIPLREGTSGYTEHDREKYKWRHLVEKHKGLSTGWRPCRVR